MNPLKENSNSIIDSCSLKEQFNNSEYEMLNVLGVLWSTQNSRYDCYHQPQRAIQQLRIWDTQWVGCFMINSK